MTDMKTRRYHIDLNGRRVCRTQPLPRALDALPIFAGDPAACYARRIAPSAWVARCAYADDSVLQIVITPVQ